MLRLPNTTQRVINIGKTGSGKTVAGLWHLSKAHIDLMPWIVIDFKTDRIINSIPRAHYIEFEEDVPKKPGVYIVQPLPNETGVALEEFLWKVWAQGNTGLFVDETYVLGLNNAAFNAILTQGRSRHIPVIANTQRPVWISRFAFSEADFFHVFELNDASDKDRIAEFTPIPVDEFLPAYHSYYYDVAQKSLHKLAPVPNEAEILKSFDTKLKRKSFTFV